MQTQKVRKSRKSRFQSTNATSNSNYEEWNCKLCSKQFSDETDKIVQCEYCNDYYCSKCLNLSKSDYEVFKIPSLHWFCPECDSKVMQNLKHERQIEERCAVFMQAMENRTVTLETEIKTKVSSDQVKEIVESVINESKNKVTTDTNRVDLDIAQTVEKKVSEIRESTIKEKNIIMYGISETNDKIPAVRKESDTRYVEQLTTFLDINCERYENVIRLGKSGEKTEKPRPLKVTFKTTDDKKCFMKNLSKLKGIDENSPFTKIGVTHDMTKSEREANKAKLNEAKEKNDNNP